MTNENQLKARTTGHYDGIKTWLCIERFSGLLDDQQEVIMQLLADHADWGLLTTAWDPNAAQDWAKWGLNGWRVLNMFDDLQDVPADWTIDYQLDHDARVGQTFDLSRTILHPQTGKTQVQEAGVIAGTIVNQPNINGRWGTIDWQDDLQQRWRQDTQDRRGFVSRQATWDFHNQAGIEWYLDVTGRPVLEVSHMAELEQWRLLKGPRTPDWIVANERSLILWWLLNTTSLARMRQEGWQVINLSRALDPVWGQVAVGDHDQVTRLIGVKDVQTDPSLVQTAGDWELGPVLAVNPVVADKLKITYAQPWQPRLAPVAQPVSHYRIVIRGRWLTTARAQQLTQVIDQVWAREAAVTIVVIGYFSTGSVKHWQAWQKGLSEDARGHLQFVGGLSGKAADRLLQTATVAWVQPDGDESLVLAGRANQLGVPVVYLWPQKLPIIGAWVDPARIGSEMAQPAVVAQALVLGLEQQDQWRAYLQKQWA